MPVAEHRMPRKALRTWADPGFFVRGGGVQASLTKKALTFFFFFFGHQLILKKSNGHFQRNLSFSRFQGGGVQHFPEGSNFIQGCPTAYSL